MENLQTDDLQAMGGSERQDVFQGHFDECLEHLSQCLDAHFPRGSKGADKARQPIAEFCGVLTSTVRGWFERPDSVIGALKISMMCCLDLFGYRVLELEEFKGMREFAELIGYKLISIQKATELLGYSHAHETNCLLRSSMGLSKEKEERMWSICKERRLELAQKKEEARQKCRLSFPLADYVEQRKVSAVMSIMDGLLAMLDSKGVGDSFLGSLRNLSPSEKRTLLRLSERLDSLSVRLARVSHGEEETHDE